MDRSDRYELSRRAFLGAAGTAALGLAAAACDPRPSQRSSRPLDVEPLSLPPGFRQRVLSRAGERTGGLIVPGKHDGMTAIRQGGNTLLVRNHELLPQHDFPVQGPDPFDPNDGGGVTGVLVSPQREPLEEFTLLSGTRRNCAGGVTPWNTWLSCEEFRDDDHGFVFEVVPDPDNDSAPRPIREMGHFRHEAVGVDLSTGIVYLTEDAPPASFVYRFVPRDPAQRPGALNEGGLLQAMRSEDDEGPPIEVGDSSRVGWIDVDPDTAPEDASDKGAIAFRKLEGALFSDGVFWFPDTNGGPRGLGQIFRYSPEEETLELTFEASDEEEMQKPDNLTMTPWGDLWFVEDGIGVDRVMGIAASGASYEFARNRLSDKELSGPCFSPDGKTFFVNIYDPGITIAVWGPFESWRRA